VWKGPAICRGECHGVHATPTQATANALLGGPPEALTGVPLQPLRFSRFRTIMLGRPQRPKDDLVVRTPSELSRLVKFPLFVRSRFFVFPVVGVECR
jgi:hypothetical protein